MAYAYIQQPGYQAVPALQQPGAPAGWMQPTVSGPNHSLGFEHLSQIQSGPPPAPPPGAATTWMQPAGSTPNCPPGLDYLAQIDRIVVVQQVNLKEVFTSWESKNKYAVHNQCGQQIFFAYEESDTLDRQCCGSSRGYIMHLVDNYQREVMRIERPFVCCGYDQTTIEAPPGNLIGLVKQTEGCCNKDFVICAPDGTVQLQFVSGPNECGACDCGSDRVFEVGAHGYLIVFDNKAVDWVQTLDGATIGEIRKKWMGFAQEYYTDADTFTVNFPLDLSVHTKASLIGATFLIDFLCFEDDNAGDRRRR